MRVLVVEDEKSLREIVAARLSREGHAVDTAADGMKAFECIEEGAYDCIVLDIMLPKTERA